MSTVLAVAGRVTSAVTPAPAGQAAEGRADHRVPKYPPSGVPRHPITGAVTAGAPDTGTLPATTRIISLRVPRVTRDRGILQYGRGSAEGLGGGAVLGRGFDRLVDADDGAVGETPGLGEIQAQRLGQVLEQWQHVTAGDREDDEAVLADQAEPG